MVNPLALAGAMPAVQGFGPLPVSVMIPFQQAQTGAMAWTFGVYYEAGKRIIKSLDNEVFNNLMKGGTGDLDILVSHKVKQLIDIFLKDVNSDKINQMTMSIMDNMVQVEKMKVKANVQLWKELPPEYINTISEMSGAETIQQKSKEIGGSIGDYLKEEVAKITNSLGITDPNADKDKFKPPPPKEEQSRQSTPIPEPEPEPEPTKTIPRSQQKIKFVIQYKVDGRNQANSYTKTESEHKATLLKMKNAIESLTKTQYGSYTTRRALAIRTAYAKTFHDFYGYWV